MAGELQQALNCHAHHGRTASDVRVRVHLCFGLKVPHNHVQGRVIALCNAGLVQRMMGNIADANVRFLTAWEGEDSSGLCSYLTRRTADGPCVYISLHIVLWRSK